MKKKQKEVGLTLFELLVMLVIVGILVRVAIPSFTSLINRYRLSSTAESLYYTLQQARTEAVKLNNNVYFSFTTGTNWCWGLKASASCDCTSAGSCNLGSNATLASNQITLSATGYGSNHVIFEGTHGAAQNSGTITLTLNDASAAITIRISRLGNLQMCATGLSGYTAC